MHKYIIGIISFFENENKLYVVEAEDEIEGMKKAILASRIENDFSVDDFNDLHTIGQIKDYMFDMDESISSPMEISMSEFPIEK